MKIMTCYVLETDSIEAFTENENWQDAQNKCQEYVWQDAPNKETAIAQHQQKISAFELDSTKAIY